MAEQLSMFGLFEPEPVYAPVLKRSVMTRAYGRDTLMTIPDENPDPEEIEVNGIKTLIVWGFGPAVYAVEKPGSLFWSSTGFWSLSVANIRSNEEIAAHLVSRKPVPWWPLYVNMWRDDRSFFLRNPSVKESPEQSQRQAEYINRMFAEGIDPNAVDAPPQHKGAWPLYQYT
ncbi:hypothetical protein D2T29_12610 [Sinirhodobacter populi]|uniref:Uncharacterized protein n=1 Tax=Paenirhodobacter populi TaxID=2306993 RepID=A0A443KCT5_9RHOB|nr:hypothetical protein [Sinirhodobacter populi]RWR30506.1 hypothetical protein D2T29_12610 [Sinirhodobacter populi]